MADRIRMFFDTDEALRLAVNMEALRAGKTVSEFLAEIVMEKLRDAVKEAEKTIEERGPTFKSTRGRKPKKS